VLALLVLLATAAHAAPARLTDADVRVFVARQEAAWNARDAKAWAAHFTLDARFVDQARGSDNSLVPNGTSTLAEAAAQAKRFFAKATFRDRRGPPRRDRPGRPLGPRLRPRDDPVRGGGRPAAPHALHRDRAHSGPAGRPHPLSRPDRHRCPLPGHTLEPHPDPAARLSGVSAFMAKLIV